ncbi:polyphenol oxidase family protein [Georgenia satyanarayanai]|uniref:polyphenol oxidase family protein n=1 Tax=Georgenia satyanarayanai TaxID=860221 RepID=UPI0020405397|nr:polyphenol oxidase family protein [Georgenia satyanarayanai]MCM3661840.1 polyphenol oxidase family protein [Georgenia satyanarayanai]
MLEPADLGPGARGGFTPRAGGVSCGPYAAADGSGGLNLAFHVDDDEDRVIANRDLLDRWAGHHVAWMSQRHSARVRLVTRPPGAGRSTLGECDSLVARRSGTGAPAVAVMVADCVPLLLATPSGDLVAAVHVGRQGLADGVVPATLATLAGEGASVPELYASLGPSICGRCYEVPAELREVVAAVVPAASATTAWGTPSLDIPAGVLAQLAAAGVRRVQHVDACTREDERFYSFRRDGVTGRFVGVVRPA